ncbi:hypothetical protein Dform_01718 [Dehalogenimonas formicexedens]|uniref:Uncharacterized protein n=1 Tax=Dehalogenimonas formicexedens TaxID=1839801 RepID=A0A1P8F997_9CHLR|nr:hypothetical protein [Dehalogenimonas formicexedens]APV45037.1 hypothetical protein Dform_01718 [Dehalogenimonas formicexedens]
MWNNYFTLLTIVALLRADYEISKPPEETNPPAASRSLRKNVLAASQREWADKAVRKYAEAQDKKWRNWQEAMFELE